MEEKELSTIEEKKRTKTDTFIGLLIPLVLLLVFSYQELFSDGGNSAILAALIIFGLAAAGSRFDAVIARIIEKR